MVVLGVLGIHWRGWGDRGLTFGFLGMAPVQVSGAGRRSVCRLAAAVCSCPPDVSIVAPCTCCTRRAVRCRTDTILDHELLN